jgi:hypothetical protein
MSIFRAGRDAMKGLHDLHGASGHLGQLGQMQQELQHMADALSAPGGLAHLTGMADPDVLRGGLLGQGMIVSVRETGTSVGSEHDPRPVCEWVIEVRLDNVQPYNALVRQSVQLAWLPQFVPGQTLVAVRVDPADHSRVVLDFASQVPTVTRAAQPGALTMADVLASGEPARAVVTASQPLRSRNEAGLELYALVLTILQEGHAPRQVTVGNPVPAACVPLLYPGSNMPARAMPGQPQAVAIDWDAALAEASR